MLIWLMTITSKEQFLIDHNRLSPLNLQATFALLTDFQQQKKPLLKDEDWSFKLRIPFIVWLDSMPPEEKERMGKSGKQEYKNYPETK